MGSSSVVFTGPLRVHWSISVPTPDKNVASPLRGCTKYVPAEGSVTFTFEMPYATSSSACKSSADRHRAYPLFPPRLGFLDLFFAVGYRLRACCSQLERLRFFLYLLHAFSASASF